MQATRTPAFLRTAAHALGALLLVPLLSACPKGDVGAPCNHGDVQPPDSKVVTFPALSCNDLICVYADEATPPVTPCTGDGDCNVPGETVKFACNVSSGVCSLSSQYVLERSMCSKTCGSDDDCLDGGITKKVLAKESNCGSNFKCVQIQKLGEFCCQKLCVCNDDLSQGTVDMLATECAALPQVNGKPVCEDQSMGQPMGTTTTAG